MMPTVYLVSGPVHSGKTTRLAAWCKGRSDVGGILQLEADGQRFFEDIQSGRRYLMDAGEREKKVYTIGKYRFYTAAFAWASDLLVEAPEQPGIKWLVIDEIGPLEMKGEGLAPVLEGLLQSPLPGVQLIIVVREELVEKVLKRYRIKDRVNEFDFPE